MNQSRFHLLKLSWVAGILCVWTLVWAVMGVRYLFLLGANPHPFLPDLSYTGIMLAAVRNWALWALAAHAVVGLVAGFLVFLFRRLGDKGDVSSILGFRKGLWVGLGTVLWIHGVLYVEVPGSITMLNGLRRLPMGLVLLALLGLGAWAVARGLSLGRRWRDLARLACGLLALVALLQLPHDLFRRFMPRPPRVDPAKPRLLILGVDGLRRDVAEKALPSWAPPGGAQPVVVVPATRLAWNILLGADASEYGYRFVIPFRSELEKDTNLVLLSEAQQKGLSTAFVIDDCTTLCFGLLRTPFSEVVEPGGGWKHFFTVGAGNCWPVYSWAENYVSPVETTNPWSDVDAYLRDVERTLDRNQWVSSHTCQLHTPFYLRLKEIQKLEPWKWLFHSSRRYESYQSQEQAERDHYSRQGRWANPVNHYKIRIGFLLRKMDEWIKRQEARYPNLSGVVTSDHGEEHLPVITPDNVLVSYLDGIHGFDLQPGTLNVPLHPFGRTRSTLDSHAIYSWLDLRDDLRHWVADPSQLVLTRGAPEGWLLRFPTVQAIHTLPKELREQGGVSGAGKTPGEFVRNTYLGPLGHWFMDDPPESEKTKVRFSYAIILPGETITFNPVNNDEMYRARFRGYEELEGGRVSNETALEEIGRFKGRTLQGSAKLDDKPRTH